MSEMVDDKQKNFQGPSQIVEIDFARITRLKKDEENGVPSSIIIQLECSGNRGKVSTFGEIDLFSKGKHVLIGEPVWRGSEDVLKGLLGLTFDLSNRESVVSEVQYLINQVLEGNPFTKRGTSTFRMITSAILKAFDNLLDAYSEGSPVVKGPYTSLDDFYNKVHQRIFRAKVFPEPPVPLYEGQAPNTYPELRAVSLLPSNATPSYTLLHEALKFGLTSTFYPKSALIVSDADGNSMGFKASMSPLTSAVARGISNHKEATRVLLKRANVAAPEGRVFALEDKEIALEYAESIGYPVVSKPVAGFKGIGVVANIQNREQLEQALELHSHSKLSADDFIIEKHVFGEDYRIVVVDGQVIACVLRMAASVLGNGKHTVADLIFEKNRMMRQNPQRRMSPIKLTERGVHHQLALAGLTLASVPEDGQKVLLAGSANLSLGGDSFEVSNEVHPSIKDLAIRAVEAIPGLEYCGVDLLIEDHRKPADEQDCTVIELNSAAAMGSAQYSMWGRKVPVARRVMEAAGRANGVNIPPSQMERLTVKLTIRGRVVGVGFRAWMKKKADQLGVTGTIENKGSRKVTAFIEGSSDEVAALARLAIVGPERAVPSSVTAVPIEPGNYSEFTILK